MRVYSDNDQGTVAEELFCTFALVALTVLSFATVFIAVSIMAMYFVNSVCCYRANFQLNCVGWVNHRFYAYKK